MQVQHFPIDRTYSNQHSWLALAPGDRFADYPIRAGLTPLAVRGHEVVAVELPPVRSIVAARVPCGSVRLAGRAAFPIYSPIAGMITIHNAEAIARPESVAEDSFHTGWLFAVLPTPRSSTNGLLTLTQYLEETGATV
jgi:glycine cleavage system H protein